MKTISSTLAIALLFATCTTCSQNQEYVALLPKVKEQVLPVEPSKPSMAVIKVFGTDNKFLVFERIIEPIIEQSYQEIKPRWINKLPGVDIYGRSHVRAMLIYVRWDDKL